MNEIVFVTHNKGKIASASRQLDGVNFKVFEFAQFHFSAYRGKSDIRFNFGLLFIPSAITIWAVF